MLRLASLLFSLTLVSLSWAAETADTDKVYLVAKFDVDGTTYNEVVFFQDDAIDELADCNREIMYGRRGGWQVYTHITKAVSGFTYSTSYACAAGAQRFSDWDRSGRAPRSQVFSVTIKNERLEVKSHASYSQCMGWVRQRGGETSKQYCGKSAQRIVNQ
ncbi:MAG: hypothetical protein ACPH3N_10215 [Alcanivorax sediminis]|uniref:hypothetical protein n=1 Tax=Alcanivorax sediminis TaxID=2663008 RepID=UPI003C474984